MRRIGVLIFFVGLCVFIFGMHLTDAYGEVSGFLQFMKKMLVIAVMLIGGIVVMVVGNWIGKQR